jgi:arylsulfatase
MGATHTRRRILQTAALAAAASPARAQARPPNVALIFCDDLGYGDLGCYGGRIRTPHLDRLAAEGMRFTHCLSANPVCSPSRAALLTGRYPTRMGVPRVLFPRDASGLPDSETTLAQALKPRGYKTMCVGKWHLGHQPPYLPTRRGFDAYFGIPYSNDMEPPVLLRGEQTAEPRADMDRLTGQYTEEAVKFIAASQGAPFFLYLPHTMPHIPLGAGPRFKGKSPMGIYGDVVEEIDWSVGEILAAVKKRGAERNTLVLFSSDNGPWFQGSPGRLRGRKGMNWEGGVRVPLLAWLPGRVAAGRVCDGLVSLMDVCPTVTRLCGAQPPDAADGVDIWPLLSGAKPELERDVVLYFDDVNVQCARWGKWKLHVARHNNVTYSPAPAGGRVSYWLAKPELYDLAADPDESFDVADRHPEVVRKTGERMEALMAGFPEVIREAWAAQKARVSAPVATGAVTRGKT